MAQEYQALESVYKRQADRLKEAAQRKLNQQFTGRLGSGAAAKISSKALSEIDVGLQDQLAKLSYEQAAKEREERLIKEGQAFQTGERIGSQEFGASEAEKGRLFQTGEREASQAFGSSEAEKGRTFQTGERLGSQQFASGESALQRAFQTGERLSAQDFADIQAQKGRTFQTGEREASQQFASGEAQAGRQFQTGERLGAQDFAALQAQEGRSFQTSERLGQQAFAGDEAARQRGFAREERMGTQDFQASQSSLDRLLQQMNINLGFEQLREQQRQFATEFEENVRTGLFNRIVALKDVSPDKLSSIINMLTGTDTGRAGELRQIISGTTGIPNTLVNAPFVQ